MNKLILLLPQRKELQQQKISKDKDDSDYLAFKETAWSYSKFVYCSTFLCKPVPPRSQPIHICSTTITNMQTDLGYGIPAKSILMYCDL